VDEQTLRELIEDVRHGRLGRRRFVQMLATVGLTAPLAAQMLASAGVAAAEPRERGHRPQRRGGGGDLRILMWDAPNMLHPHFGRRLADFTASRIFYEPLAAPAPDGTFVPVLADELPSVMNGLLARDGQWVTWRLRKGVSWHDGKPFTADDVVFNWEFAVDPATTASSRAAYDEIARIDKLDSHTVKVVFKKPQPFWARVFTGDGLLPKHVFEKHKGAGAREAFGTIKAVGTGPYRLTDFKPGDLIRAELNPHYHVHHRPFFDRVEIKGGGDAVGSARAVMQTGECSSGWSWGARAGS
jgi:peptide/nickel transport system substrate-binding protein